MLPEGVARRGHACSRTPEEVSRCSSSARHRVVAVPWEVTRCKPRVEHLGKMSKTDETTRRHGETAGCVSNVNQLCGENKKSASDAFQCPEKKTHSWVDTLRFSSPKVSLGHVPG